MRDNKTRMTIARWHSALLGGAMLLSASACATSPAAAPRSLPDEAGFLDALGQLDPRWTDSKDEKRARAHDWADARRTPAPRRTLLVATVERMMLDRSPADDMLAPVECAAPAVVDLWLESTEHPWLSGVEPAHRGFDIVQTATRCMLADDPPPGAPKRIATVNARVALHRRTAPWLETLESSTPPSPEPEPTSLPDADASDAALARTCRLTWYSLGPRSCATERRSSDLLELAAWTEPASDPATRAFVWAQIDDLHMLVEHSDPHDPATPLYLFLLAQHYVALEQGSTSARLANAAASEALEHLARIARDPRYAKFRRRDESIIRAIEIAWRTGDRRLGCSVVADARSIELRPWMTPWLRRLLEELDCASLPAPKWDEGEGEL